MKKTVAQVLKEYKNRQDNFKYRWIGVLEDVGQYEQFSYVSNLENTEDECGKWLEFDVKSIYGTKHIKVHGHIVKYETFINTPTEQKVAICKECDNIKSVHDITLCKDCSSSY